MKKSLEILTPSLKRHCEERFLRRSNPGKPLQNSLDCCVAKNAPRNDASGKGGISKQILLFIVLLPVALFAAGDFYPFSSPIQQQRFTQLTTELRCLVCQNQNLAESNAPLAADLRQQVYQHLRAGESDEQIIHYLVSRYGDFILYRPPVNKATLGLWLVPGLFLLIGIIYLLNYIRKK